jgi:hypothetical protein
VAGGALAALVASLALVGSAYALSRSQFVARADAVCLQSRSHARAFNDGEKAALARSSTAAWIYLGSHGPAYVAESAHDLRALVLLPRPASITDFQWNGWQTYLYYEQLAVAALQRMVNAVRGGTEKQFREGQKQLIADIAEARTIIKVVRLGFHVCGLPEAAP